MPEFHPCPRHGDLCMVGWPCRVCVFVDEERWKDPRIPGWLRPLMREAFNPPVRLIRQTLGCRGSMDIQVYEDGSGAPAMVTVKGWTFALDFLGGEVKSRLITQCSSRKPPKWAADWARTVYRAELENRAPAGWFEKAKAMYAPEAK